MSATSDRPLRADARRNRERLLDAAVRAFSHEGQQDGQDVTLDAIAKDAGVGIGTLYRHFPTRAALQEAVILDHVQALCDGARDLADSEEASAALTTWLRQYVTYLTTKSGLAKALLLSVGSDSTAFAHCHAEIRGAARALLESAQHGGTVRDDVSLADLLRLVWGIAVASEKAPDPPEAADRLLALVTDGLRDRVHSKGTP